MADCVGAVRALSILRQLLLSFICRGLNEQDKPTAPPHTYTHARTLPAECGAKCEYGAFVNSRNAALRPPAQHCIINQNGCCYHHLSVRRVAPHAANRRRARAPPRRSQRSSSPISAPQLTHFGATILLLHTCCDNQHTVLAPRYSMLIISKGGELRGFSSKKVDQALPDEVNELF